MKYVGIWHGGASYSPSEWADHAEYFYSIADAKTSLEHRLRGYGHFVKIVWGDDGKPAGTQFETVETPAVTDDSEIWLVPLRGATLEALERDGYPDRIVKFGPRGGTIVERS